MTEHENIIIRILKCLGIVKENEVSKAEMCKQAQNVCDRNCEQCAWGEQPMTIDEMIKFILCFLQGRRNGKNAGLQIIKALEELKWYREQYLIKREDALERITHLKRLEKHIDHAITLHHSYCAVAEIPKAEPPKE